MLASLNNASKNYGTRQVLSNVNLTVEDNARVGFIGPNGSGKSTVMGLLTGRVVPDSGSVWVKDGLSVGYLSQDMGLDPEKTVYENALEAFRDLIRREEEIEKTREAIEQASDPKLLEKLGSSLAIALESFEADKGYYFRSLASSALLGMGFKGGDLDRPVSSLSGGQKMRIALTRLLLSFPSLLLLDEPTNYLDLNSIAWLENFLVGYPNAYVVVSHDRYFLEKTASWIWLAENGQVTPFRGNYSAYLVQKTQRDADQAKAYALAKKEEDRQLAIIARLKSYNREKSVRAAESREKALARMKMPERPKNAKVSRFGFAASDVITKNALTLKNLEVGYGTKRVAGVFDMAVSTGDKIGICADNAAGKSTLFKTIMSEIPPYSGECILGAGVSPVIFRQERAESLNMDATLFAEVSAYSGADAGVVRNVLGALLFSEDDVYKPISVLSGGEKSRVDVAKLMLTRANMLLLDEPTNHLDIESREVFEEAMRGYEGTLMVISHDRYLLKGICTKMIFIQDGQAYVYTEPYEKASELFAADLAAKANPQAPASGQGKGQDTQKPSEPAQGLSKNRRKFLKDMIAQTEKQVARLGEEIGAMELEIASPDFWGPDSDYASALAAYDDLKAELARTEEAWLAYSEELEANPEA